MELMQLVAASRQAMRYGAQVGNAIYHGTSFMDIYDAYRAFRNQFEPKYAFNQIEDSFDYGWDHFEEVFLGVEKRKARQSSC